MNAGIMKSAIVALNDSMKSVGREVNVDEVAEIVQAHALATSISAAVSGAIPGVGGTVAMGIACTSTITMYGRLANAMGVRLNNGLIRALASGVVADLGATVAASLAVTAAVSFIPGVGNMAASTLTAIVNYGFVYLAGLIFIKMIAALGVTRAEHMSEAEMMAAAKATQDQIDVKKAMKEAHKAYKANT